MMPSLLPFKSTLFLWLLVCTTCSETGRKPHSSPVIEPTEEKAIRLGAENMDGYLPLLKGRRIGLVANQTSVIPSQDDPARFTHLVDTLMARDITIHTVFAPEHGFRGKADAGEKVEDGKDPKTGLSILSLYGQNRKPAKENLSEIELLLFDIQDVGVRFYTYIATLQYVMEAGAENNIPVIVLDRPNPNGHYVDGPTMETEFKSFLGLNSIPLVYGMTIGEYARMINEEGWLSGGVKADLTVIPLEHYTHNSRYELPVRPSPNLPNAKAINLYPSLGLFEGTTINAGRGTEYQFQRYGSPHFDPQQFELKYTPKANFGAKQPKYKDVLCYGEDLTDTTYLEAVQLQWLIKAYVSTPDKSAFFLSPGFARHAGTAQLQQQIEAGWSETRIKASWKPQLDAFQKIREKYLIYP